MAVVYGHRSSFFCVSTWMSEQVFARARVRLRRRKWKDKQTSWTNEQTNKLCLLCLCAKVMSFCVCVRTEMCLFVKFHINNAPNFFETFTCSLKLNNHPQSYSLICTISDQNSDFQWFLFVERLVCVCVCVFSEFVIKMGFLRTETIIIMPNQLKTYKIRNETYLFLLLIKWSSHLNKLQVRWKKEYRNTWCLEWHRIHQEIIGITRTSTEEKQINLPHFFVG